MTARTQLLGISAMIGAAIAATGPAQAQSLGPATTPQIVAGVQSCIAATSAEQVNQPQLEADGWAVATPVSEPVKLPVIFLAKGSVLLLIAAPSSPAPACFIVAGLVEGQTFAAVADEIDTALGVPRKRIEGEDAGYYWFPEGHALQLIPTGTPQEAAVRIAVTAR